MTVHIEKLSPETEGGYEKLLMEVPTSLLYHSLQYRRFLKQILADAKDHYLVAIEGDQVIAAIPAFIKTGSFGAVVNSLPFYGSNGSIVAKKDCLSSVNHALLQAFDQMCKEVNAVTSTIVANPLELAGELPADYKPDLLDERIGQITPLPSDIAMEELGAHLIRSFHVKTRNLVRKGERSGFDIGHDGSDDTMHQLHALHESNMAAIGGLAKPWAVFQAIQQNFAYDRDYRIYTAKKNGRLAASLLVFFSNKTAEYFIPVIQQEYRSDQPLSYLIFVAMQDAVIKGCRWWNWGGTWLSQDGVYHFKSRWGTKDYKYKYFIKAHSDLSEIKNKNVDEILAQYPYFYVLPFSEIVCNE